MAERRYIYSVTRRTPMPRSKRLRDCGVGSSVATVAAGGLTSAGGTAGADGFSPTITFAQDGAAVVIEVTNRTGSDTYRIDFGAAVEAAVTNANAAATAANEAAANANEAAANADSAAVNANSAADSANAAAAGAESAVTNATTAADSANQAAKSANDAAASASDAAASANSAADSANAAALGANSAADSANAAATNANAAAQAAYEAIEALGDIANIQPITDEEIDELLKNFNFIDSFTVTAHGEDPLTLEATNTADGADIAGSVDISEIAEEDIRKAFENG